MDYQENLDEEWIIRLHVAIGRGDHHPTFFLILIPNCLPPILVHQSVLFPCVSPPVSLSLFYGGGCSTTWEEEKEEGNPVRTSLTPFDTCKIVDPNYQ